MGIGAHSNITFNRPEDVFRLGSVIQQDSRVTVDGEVSCDLHDSDGILVVLSIEGDYTVTIPVNGDNDVTIPRI